MNIFIDNDVVIKLAKYDLLNIFGALLLDNGHTIYTLDSLPYICGIGKSSNQTLETQMEEDAITKFHGLSKRAEIQSAETISLLTKIDDPNIDPGEMVLIGCIKENDDANLCSGDKRAIKALDSVVVDKKIELSDYCIGTLEQAAKILLSCCCQTTVIEKIQCKPEVDKSLKVCFSNSSTNQLEGILGALDSYVRHIQGQCSALKFFSE